MFLMIFQAGRLMPAFAAAACAGAAMAVIVVMMMMSMIIRRMAIPALGRGGSRGPHLSVIGLVMANSGEKRVQSAGKLLGRLKRGQMTRARQRLKLAGGDQLNGFAQ